MDWGPEIRLDTGLFTERRSTSFQISAILQTNPTCEMLVPPITRLIGDNPVRAKKIHHRIRIVTRIKSKKNGSILEAKKICENLCESVVKKRMHHRLLRLTKIKKWVENATE
jgi:hypothetical protein